MLIINSTVPVEYLGFIPAFFLSASESVENTMDTEGVARGMDDAYGFGGFLTYPFEGTIDTETGDYLAAGDPPLSPIATLYNRGYILRIYDYSICSLTGDDDKIYIARFD